MSKTLKFSLLALILMVLAWAYASPYWVLHQIKQAADQNDSEKISSFIDYPSVRDSLKRQIQTQMDSKINTQGNDALSKLGSLFASSMADQLVDTLVTPEAMTLLFKAKGLHDDASAEKHSKDQIPAQSENATEALANAAHQDTINNTPVDRTDHSQTQVTQTTPQPKPDYRAGYQSPNRFVVQIKDPKSTDVDVVLQRSGLSWKVSELKVLKLSELAN